MSKEEKNTYTIKTDENLGEVKIADEVVAIIAGLAAMEVEGVASMAGNATRELISKLGMKSLSKGVKVDVLDGIVTVSLALNLNYGYSIKEITSKVQEKVKTAIENMTGLEVADVNIRVAGVEIPEEVKRTEQREHIFKLIFGADFNEESEQGTQTELYLEQIEGATEKDMQYISQKAQKIIEKIDEIDTLINEHTTGWKTGRMNKVDLTILRLAVYEMKWDEDVPTGVAINEAVNLAKKYSSEDGASFVNGVLAKLAD